MTRYTRCVYCRRKGIHPCNNGMMCEKHFEDELASARLWDDISWLTGTGRYGQ